MRRIIILVLALVLFGGCSKPAPPSLVPENPLVLINGEAVPDSEVFLALRLTIESFGTFGSEFIDWDGEIDGEPSRGYIRRQALDRVAECRAISAGADKLGCSLTAGELAEIDEFLAQEAEFSGGVDAFAKLINERYGPLEQYRFYMHEIPYLVDKLSAKLFSEGGPYEPSARDLEEYYSKNFTNCAYILLSALDDDGYPLEGAELETMRSVAEALRKQALEGAPFFELVAEHGQDYLMTIYPEGHPVPSGIHGAAFDAALSGLPVNGISDVILSDDSFYVIKRLPEQLGYLEDEDNYYEVLDAYITDKRQEIIDGWSAELTVVPSQAFNELDPALYEPGLG